MWNKQDSTPLMKKLMVHVYYCRFGNFHENFIFANSIKRHISDVENSRLRQGLSLSINDRVILPFREGFIFTKLRIAKFRENKVLAKISEFTVFLRLPPINATKMPSDKLPVYLN